MNHDSLTLARLRFHGHHGVLPAEREHGQTLEVTVTLELAPAGPRRGDDLARTADYRRVFESVRAIIAGPPRQLAESLAEDIALRLLDELPVAQAAVVEVTKPAPPVEFVFAGFTARVRRERAGA